MILTPTQTWYCCFNGYFVTYMSTHTNWYNSHVPSMLHLEQLEYSVLRYCSVVRAVRIECTNSYVSSVSKIAKQYCGAYCSNLAGLYPKSVILHQNPPSPLNNHNFWSIHALCLLGYRFQPPEFVLLRPSLLWFVLRLTCTPISGTLLFWHCNHCIRVLPLPGPIRAFCRLFPGFRGVTFF